MYNRYIPDGASYTRVTVEDGPRQRPEEPHRPERPREEQRSQSGSVFSLPGFLTGKGQGDLGGRNGLLRSLKLEKLDSGDVLLLLIVLFLLIEGDNLELVIALGLVLLMGLGDDREEEK